MGLHRTGAGGRVRAESSGPGREMSPMHTSGASSVRESGEPSSSSALHQPQAPHFGPSAGQVLSGRTGAHSVSSLLSDHPQSPRATTTTGAAAATTATHFAPGSSSEGRHHHQHPMQQQHHHQHQLQHPMQHSQPPFAENERRHSPRSSEEKLRSGGGGGGGLQGSTATRPGDND